MRNPKPDRRTPELNRIWHLLTINDRHSWLRLARHLRENYRLRPVYFSLRASLLSFFILAFLPIHPMSIFIALGGGIALALITYI